VASLGTSYFYWRAVFGGFVGRLWRGGVLTRVLLLILALFIAGPLIRGALNLARSLFKQVQLLARRVRFRLERKWRVEAAELIDSLPIFDDVPEDALSDLAGRVRLRSLSAGQPVVRQGERASAFYVVRKGTLQVVEEDPASGRERPLRVLGRGEAFGELALKEGSLRTATVRAVEEAEVFEIDKSTFDHLLADMVHVPQFAPTLQAVAEVKELPCFSHLEPDELFDLLEHGEWLNLSPGESIVEQGEEGDSFFAIGSGQAEVFEDGKFKRTLGPGAYFGEIALLFDVPRTATVVARTPMRAYRLGREGFDRLVAGAFKRGTLNPHAALDRTSHH
jgi:cAMP-dependent protein kinase regulator